MKGDMQSWTPNIAGIIEHANKVFPDVEVVSKLVSGETHRTNYGEVCIRSRKLASALEKNGYKEGVFHTSAGWDLVADDLTNLIQFSHEEFPNQKHYLLAHSMGSYVALSAITNNLHLSGLILSGSSHISPVTLFIQKMLIKIVVLIKGRDKKSNFLDSITMRTFNDKFKPTQTPNDWISTDMTNVKDYTNDPMCGFIASNGLWDDMASSFKSIYNKNHYSCSDHELPILIISGDKDPVGEMGAGVKRLYEFLKSIFKNTSFILLKNERHEVFSGLDKSNTYSKLKTFLMAH